MDEGLELILERRVGHELLGRLRVRLKLLNRLSDARVLRDLRHLLVLEGDVPDLFHLLLRQLSVLQLRDLHVRLLITFTSFC